VNDLPISDLPPVLFVLVNILLGILDGPRGVQRELLLEDEGAAKHGASDGVTRERILQVAGGVSVCVRKRREEGEVLELAEYI
jgi:hypothetical protein